MEFPGESPLTSFAQLHSPGQEPNTATPPHEGNVETPAKWIVPDDLPIDLRVKIAVCLIHVRQLHSVEVTMEMFLSVLLSYQGLVYTMLEEFEKGALFCRYILVYNTQWLCCCAFYQEILAPLFLEPVQEVGDLYIDVGEAYAENGKYSVFINKKN